MESPADNGTVLIVEDDEGTARAVSRLVQSLGLVPRVAPLAKQALETLSQTHDLRALVVDLRLPDGDGFWVAEAARRSSAGLPIVILTAAMSSAIVNQAFRLGAQYLCKPLAPKDIASLRLFLLGAPPQPIVDRLKEWARDKQLSPRQTEILTLALAEIDADAMAELLGTTKQAVDENIARMVRTLGASDLQAVVRTLRQITEYGR